MVFFGFPTQTKQKRVHHVEKLHAKMCAYHPGARAIGGSKSRSTTERRVSSRPRRSQRLAWSLLLTFQKRIANPFCFGMPLFVKRYLSLMCCQSVFGHPYCYMVRRRLQAYQKYDFQILCHVAILSQPPNQHTCLVLRVRNARRHESCYVGI